MIPNVTHLFITPLQYTVKHLQPDAHIFPFTRFQLFSALLLIKVFLFLFFLSSLIQPKASYAFHQFAHFISFKVERTNSQCS